MTKVTLYPKNGTAAIENSFDTPLITVMSFYLENVDWSIYDCISFTDGNKKFCVTSERV